MPRDPNAVVLSRGARLCEAIIRRSRTYKGGARRVRLEYLAAHLGCTTRTVSRYLRELRRDGRVHVKPPMRERTPAGGWRSVGSNTYRFPVKWTPAPHMRRSHRDDTGVAPSTSWSSRGSRSGPRGGSAPPRIDPAAYARMLQERFGLELPT